MILKVIGQWEVILCLRGKDTFPIKRKEVVPAYVLRPNHVRGGLAPAMVGLNANRGNWVRQVRQNIR